ncbi:competence type IV pilus minor pilin ComGG [Cytobacillus purgationiresistens]|uniref:Competence protein ComGG n=1 Tax=Cytobacillus purgationiresistens TaxID=863449 RepID=A0ABU0AF66_9BACI|nr:competence type IV pilus minor pilin ComGG [Cytobacillus purgationiresistens]MDQ0269422.1 competence protein ComGG [Cytobacillus purgationiresistens]
MLSNEKGLVYPLALIMMVILSLLLSIHLELYISEKRILHEGKKLLQQEYYFFNSLKRVEDELLINSFALLSGKYQYNGGRVEYTVKEIAHSLLEVKLVIKMDSSKDIVGYGYYDRDLQRVIKWIEKV